MTAPELAKRYGQALLTLAEAQGVQQRVVDELDALVALIGREPLLKTCLANPTLPVDAKQAMLSEIMAPACSPLTQHFAGLLVRSRRADLLADIVRVLQTTLEEQAGWVEVKVESAIPLTDADRVDVTRRLSHWLNKKVRVELTVVPDLLAGITIRIGDRLVDGSFRGQLARMRYLLMT